MIKHREGKINEVYRSGRICYNIAQSSIKKRN